MVLHENFQRGGGYYVDVGVSQLIIDGKIKIKQGKEITEVKPRGCSLAETSWVHVIYDGTCLRFSKMALSWR